MLQSQAVAECTELATECSLCYRAAMTVPILPLDRDLAAAMLRDLDTTVTTVAADVDEPPATIRPAVELIIHLLCEARDLEEAMTRLRADGEAGAHVGILAERLLDRYLSTLWVIWELREPEPWDRGVIEQLARRLLHAGDVIVAAVASGYRAVDRELVARDVEARRAFLEELLGSMAVDAAAVGRVRRHALARGLDPDDAFRLVAIAAEVTDEAFDEAVSRLGAGLGILSAGERARTGLTLPQVIGWRGRIVVLARGEWPGLPRLRGALDAALGEREAHGQRAGLSRAPDSDAPVGPAWTAVVGSVVQGVEAPGTRPQRARRHVAHRRAPRTSRLDRPSE